MPTPITVINKSSVRTGVTASVVDFSIYRRRRTFVGRSETGIIADATFYTWFVWSFIVRTTRPTDDRCYAGAISFD